MNRVDRIRAAAERSRQRRLERQFWEEPMSAARGCLIGLLLGAALWALIGLAVWAVWFRG